jgi:hypothetical protein
MGSKDELQDYVLNETGFLKNTTPDEILDNFKLARHMNRQYGIAAGDPHTYLKPELVHLMNQHCMKLLKRVDLNAML